MDGARFTQQDFIGKPAFKLRIRQFMVANATVFDVGNDECSV